MYDLLEGLSILFSSSRMQSLLRVTMSLWATHRTDRWGLRPTPNQAFNNRCRAVDTWQVATQHFTGWMNISYQSCAITAHLPV